MSCADTCQVYTVVGASTLECGTAVLLIKIVHSPDGGEGRIVSRTYKDMSALAKQRVDDTAGSCVDAAKEFPATRLKQLLSGAPWSVGGAGWLPQMSKGLNLTNLWLQSLSQDSLSSFCDEDVYMKARLKLQARLLSEKHARKMQQYFMSPANIEFIVNEALKCPQEHTIFVEPSCGDGRLLVALAARPAVTAIVGCELDPGMASRALEACRSSSHSRKCSVYSRDFLATTRLDLIPVERRGLNTDVVVCGGPPYTAGGGDGSLVSSGDPSADTGRDLPLQFIRHAACVLGARLIVYLLPPRCGEPAFIDRTKANFLCKNGEALSHVGDEWNVVTLQAPNNEFDFCGRIIRQPSIIQIWRHNSSSTCNNSYHDYCLCTGDSTTHSGVHSLLGAIDDNMISNNNNGDQESLLSVTKLATNDSLIRNKKRKRG